MVAKPIPRVHLLLASLTVAGVLALSALPAPVHAAPDPGIVVRNMAIDLRPEYDTSDVLIIYDFSLANTGASAYSGEVSFHVPKGATNQVHICEQVGSDKHALCRPYQTSDAGDSTLMTWKPSKPIEAGQSYPIYVEYYYNPIQGSPDKTIAFKYHPSYPVDSLDLAVTQPLRSSNWSLTPAPASTGGTGDGMTQSFYRWQNLGQDSSVDLAISYTKADNKPSVAQQATDLATASGMSTGAKVGIGAAVLALFGGLLFLGLRRPSPSPAGRQHPAPYRPQPVKPAARPQQAAAPVRQSPPVRQGPPVRPGPLPSAFEQKKLARAALLQGKISEATYKSIVADIEADAGAAQ